jgi:hypothetical protein
MSQTMSRDGSRWVKGGKGLSETNWRNGEKLMKVAHQKRWDVGNGVLALHSMELDVLWHAQHFHAHPLVEAFLTHAGMRVSWMSLHWPALLLHLLYAILIHHFLAWFLGSDLVCVVVPSRRI